MTTDGNSTNTAPGNNGSGNVPPTGAETVIQVPFQSGQMPPRPIQFGQFDKPEKFKGGNNFKLWKEKMVFLSYCLPTCLVYL